MKNVKLDKAKVNERSVYVTGFKNAGTWNHLDLFIVFRDAGFSYDEIQNCKVNIKNGQQTGQGWVTFTNEADVERAIERLNKKTHFVPGKGVATLKVERCNPPAKE